MTPLQVKPAGSCKWDCVSLGEIMIRLDPGDERIRTTRHFRVWEGGGEYNVARGLRRCFGMRTTVVTGIVDNEVGRLLEDLMLQGGVDASHVKWFPFDGVGRRVRNPLNFTERGFGIRAAKGCSDRGHSATSQLQPGDVDWAAIFEKEGARWFHCGGIFAALSETAPAVAREAMQAARAAGAVVSYDLNYRPSLWQDAGGPAQARKVNQALASYVDVMIGNAEHFRICLGVEMDETGGNGSGLDSPRFRKVAEQAMARFPNLKAAAATLRNERSATLNDWGAALHYDGAFHEAAPRPALEILDRVGGGDGFASGLIYGFLTGKPPQECVEYGAAHGALAMTTPGDTSTTTLDEVERVVKGGGARLIR